MKVSTKERGSLRALYFCSHAKAMHAIIAALVRCSRYQPIKAGYVAQIDRAMSVYSRNKKSPARNFAGLDIARTKKPAQWRA